jgi:Iap family predicted aminopeptidase
MLTKADNEVLSDVSVEETWKHVSHLSTFNKMSGTEGEKKAHQYVRAKLQEYNVPFEPFEFDSLISHPKEASLKVVSPSASDVNCITHAFSASTAGEGIEADLVIVPLPQGKRFAGIEGLVEEYKKAGVEGKMTLVFQLARPAFLWAAQRAGALGQGHVSGEEVLHELIVTTIWGTPTSESARRIPKIPAVSIRKSDGEQLLQFARKGKVRIRLHATVDTNWRKIPLTVARIDGAEEPQKFMLIHGHMDSWFRGATDNCTGNAACLELARILWKHRSKLKRSVRIAWWSGHSTGRYSGSTWYADNSFEDLNRNCYLSMNIDSPGVKGATEIIGGGLMGAQKFIAQTLRDATGSKKITLRSHAPRNCDQSFYGIGIPSVTIDSEIPEGNPLRGAWIGGSGGGWWWHTKCDTIDKADKMILLRDLKMQTLVTLRSANCKILPFDFTIVAEEYRKVITELQTKIPDGIFQLSPVLEKTRELQNASESLNKALTGLKDRERIQRLNELLVEATRVLTSTLYTYLGRYEHDPAYEIPLIPALSRVTELVKMELRSNETKFLMTEMIRRMNKVNHQLDIATQLIRRAVDVVREPKDASTRSRS